jgi:REP-associated tyrosine transposase
MARPLRLEYPGAVYHLMARGHERSAIFREDGDRQKFQSLLAAIVTEERWELHGYCLMGNHYHLLLETPEGLLSRGMKALNARYAQWFNWRHARRGHLLEGRFRSVLVQKQTHLLELLRYVVLNPVRAGLVERAGDWEWSSYRATAGKAGAPRWLAVDWTLSQFARRRSTGRASFRQFVAEAKGSAKEIENQERSGYFGDKEFRRELQDMIDGREISDEIPLRYRQVKPARTTAEVQTLVAREWKVEVEMLTRRRGGDEKKAAVYLSKRATGLGGREIGALFGIKPAQVSHVVRQIEDQPNSTLARRVQRLRRRLNI